ncbi:hypothetical protein HC928_05145, partial [bacterium]|nr:hypothetical protein [bacterium]
MLPSLILAALAGILAGGVVNALADDLPLRRRPRSPRYVPEAKKRAIHFIPYDDVDTTATPTIEGDDAGPHPVPEIAGMDSHQ